MWRFPWVHLGKRWGIQFCRMVVNRLARENKREKEDFELGTSCVKAANVCTFACTSSDRVRYYWSNRHGRGCSPLPVMNHLLCVLCLHLIFRLRFFSILLSPYLNSACCLSCLTPFTLFVCICQLNTVACHVFIYKIEVTRQTSAQTARQSILLKDRED